MYEEAQKLGLDIGDFEDYGFDLKGSKCGGKPCFNDKIKNFKQFQDETDRMGVKFLHKGRDLMKKA